MNNILIAQETKKIIKEGQYKLAEEIIKLPEIDYEGVTVISPKAGEELLDANKETEKAELNRMSWQYGTSAYSYGNEGIR